MFSPVCVFFLLVVPVPRRYPRPSPIYTEYKIDIWKSGSLDVELGPAPVTTLGVVLMKIAD